MRGLSNCGPYGDFIQDVDLSVGRIVETLKYMNLFDNTIIIFSSDNGGVIPENKPYEEESQAIKAGLKINGNLRGRKHTIWEGGTNIPFIVSWPNKIKKASVSNHVSAFWDVMPTIAEISGAKLPNNLDGISFLPTILNTKNQQNHEYLYWEYNSSPQSIRECGSVISILPKSIDGLLPHRQSSQ